VVIREVHTAGAGSVDEEFIELYNANSAGINLNGLSLVYRSATGTSDLLVHQFANTDSIAAKGHYLLVHAGYDVGAVADATFAQQLGASGGGLSIVRNAGAIVDSIGWGTATNDFVEGTACVAAVTGESLERLPGGADGNGQDTNDNSADFVINPSPIPQNTAQ
jgi:hypothetical protein